MPAPFMLCVVGTDMSKMWQLAVSTPHRKYCQRISYYWTSWQETLALLGLWLCRPYFSHWRSFQLQIFGSGTGSSKY